MNRKLRSRILVSTLSFGIWVLGDHIWAQTASPSPPNAAASPVTAKSPNIQNDDEGPSDYVSDPISLLPDLPPLPARRATLIGGTIQNLDRLRDQMTVTFFGGGRMTVLFDPRTQVYLGAALASTDSLRQGETVHFDTILDGGRIFAKSIRVGATSFPGELQGVLLRYRADRGELTLRDALSPNPIHLRLLPSTRLTMNGGPVAASELMPGSLLALKFDPNTTGRDIASEISILARPGIDYTFRGRLVDLDLSSDLLVVESSSNSKTYEMYLENPTTATNELHPGAVVTVVAAYEGSRYVVRSFTVDSQRK
jgi:hypothetical protein